MRTGRLRDTPDVDRYYKDALRLSAAKVDRPAEALVSPSKERGSAKGRALFFRVMQRTTDASLFAMASPLGRDHSSAHWLMRRYYAETWDLATEVIRELEAMGYQFPMNVMGRVPPRGPARKYRKRDGQTFKVPSKGWTPIQTDDPAEVERIRAEIEIQKRRAM